MVIVLSNEVCPSADAVLKLYREYKMTDDGVRRDVSHIRQWMAKQAHLPRVPPAKDDEINSWIEGYLRLTKNSVERTKIAIDSYFKGKSVFCDIFAIPDFRTYLYSDVFNNVYMMLLPNLTPDGLKILLYGVTTDDPLLFQPRDFFRRMAMVLDIQQKIGIDFTGIRVILYARYGTLGHLAQFDLLLLKKVFKLARKAYPVRLKHIHIVYAPMFIEAAIKIIRPFISKKVMSRVSVHKGGESLWHSIPKENLPADFGGDLPSMSALHDMWRQKLLDHYDWFIENQNLIAGVTKRVKKEKRIDKCAHNGTFRELSFD